MTEPELPPVPSPPVPRPAVPRLPLWERVVHGVAVGLVLSAALVTLFPYVVRPMMVGDLRFEHGTVTLLTGLCSGDRFSVLTEGQSTQEVLFTTYHELSHCVIEPRLTRGQRAALHALWQTTSNTTGYVRPYSSDDDTGDEHEWVADQVARLCTHTGGLTSIEALLSPALYQLGCIPAPPVEDSP